MIKTSMLVLSIGLISLISQPIQASSHSSADELVDGIIIDVIDKAFEKAKREVLENVGVDTQVRGYSTETTHTPMPASASDETRRELQLLGEEHDRKIYKLEDELHRKLHKARDEFEREARKEDKPDKIRDKRRKLEKKVDEAYRKFDEKIRDANRKYDKKRSKILSKS